MNRDIYELSVEVRPLPGCELPCDREGAFVYCFVPAETLEESIDILRDTLVRDKLDLIDIEYCMRVYLDEWDAEDEYPSLADLRESLESGRALYSPFYGYEGHYEH